MIDRNAACLERFIRTKAQPYLMYLPVRKAICVCVCVCMCVRVRSRASVCVCGTLSSSTGFSICLLHAAPHCALPQTKHTEETEKLLAESVEAMRADAAAARDRARQALEEPKDEPQAEETKEGEDSAAQPDASGQAAEEAKHDADDKADDFDMNAPVETLVAD